ncbi:MAG: TetR/AcrR family transcriptional regulator [Anaerolineae bacterium]|nr:TetR/AcrR family transcriptional regulator [Anaerolineae bacterium]
MAESKVLSPKQRRQRNREEMIDAIVEAARQIMREQGVAALNLNEIARALGMQTPSLYEYFASKMALYDYLFRVGTRTFRDAMTRAGEGQDSAGWDQAQHYMTAYLEWSIANPDLFKLLFERHIPGFTPSDESMAEMYGALDEGRQRLEAGLSAARLDPVVTLEQARDIFIALQHGITALHLANNPELPVGQGRFGSLIPLVIDMMRIAWEKQTKRRGS